eukprot:4111304-Ditylum_brightwellii.AAC.1
MMQDDKKLYPEKRQNHKGELVLSCHPAQNYLYDDVTANLHGSMTSSQLHALRPEYQEFKPCVFNHRIRQEICRQKFINYLEDKRFEKRRQFAEEV